MTIWFVLIVLSAMAAIVVPLVGLARCHSDGERVKFVPVIGLVFCIVALVMVFFEMYGYVIQGDTSTLIDTAEAWCLIAIIFSFISLIINIVCLVAINKE